MEQVMKASVGEILNVQQKGVSSTLLDMVTGFYEGIFVGSAEEQVPTILSEAAKVFQADIATWFLVTEDRTQLRLVDVYNDLGKSTERPPAEPYVLNWKAKSENDVKGLTAWTAISGEPLHVSSLKSLTQEHGTAHAGRWDEWLYPGKQGIRDPKSGFLCMYAVPLFLPTPGPAKDRVVGVLKMERRRTSLKTGKLRECFTQADLEAFNVIARIMGFAYFHSERQRSLTLADIGHALIRPIGDVAFSLEAVADELSTRKADIEHAKSAVGKGTKMLRSLASMLTIAKESHNQPLKQKHVNITKDLANHIEAYSLVLGRRVVDCSNGAVEPFAMTKRSYAALINVAINLIDNASRAAPMHSKVEVTVKRTKDKLLLFVENEGLAIATRTLEDAMRVQDAPIRFQGLPRSYQLAARNGWHLQYRRVRGKKRNRFELTVPIHGKVGK